jgi:hypothetical protein
MLGHEFRFRALNTQNQAITVSVKARYWKFDSSGALVYSTEQTLINAVSVAATTGTTASSDIDNSTDLYIGAELLLSCTAAVTTNGTGTLAVFLERSTDGGTTWPAQIAGTCNGDFVGAYTVTAADTTTLRSKTMTVD